MSGLLDIHGGTSKIIWVMFYDSIRFEDDAIPSSTCVNLRPKILILIEITLSSLWHEPITTLHHSPLPLAFLESVLFGLRNYFHSQNYFLKSLYAICEIKSAFKCNYQQTTQHTITLCYCKNTQLQTRRLQYIIASKHSCQHKYSQLPHCIT